MRLGNIDEITKKDNEFFLFHFYDSIDFIEDFHCHDTYEIYISISGGKNFIIDDKVYDILPHDLFIHNNYEIHKTTMSGDAPYERYCLEFRPEAVLPFCTSKTNLAHIFTHRPDEFSHKISLTDEQFEHLSTLLDKCGKTEDYFAKDIYEKICFIEILIYVSELFRNVQPERETLSNEYGTIVAPILAYITENLAEDLDLDDIAAHVNISKYYLCRLFKQYTGTTINKFIIRKRVAKAKELLKQSYPVLTVCENVGFNDYSHFIRTFRKIVGVPPTKYAKENVQM